MPRQESSASIGRMQNPYTEDYYLRGISTGLSNYVSYRWLEERTMAFARRLIVVMDIRPGDTFLDYGCARGYTVKALRRVGVDAHGCDISQWAVENCDPEAKDYVHLEPRLTEYDHVLLKDVAEHVEPAELAGILDWLLSRVKRGLLLIVPLSHERHCAYVREEDDQDSTHIIRWPLEEWIKFVQRPSDEFVVSGSWHIPGLKPTSLSVPYSCGFVQVRRVIS